MSFIGPRPFLINDLDTYSKEQLIRFEASSLTAHEYMENKISDKSRRMRNIHRYSKWHSCCDYLTVAKFLVSEENKMIVGEVIHISGGRGTFDIR